MPDLLVIDGGAGQLSMALKAREDLRATVDIVALAKMRTEGEVLSQDIERKPERLFIPGRDSSLGLNEGDAVTRFLVRIRDEVHRFVITFHRDTRSRRVFRSVLDTVAGVSAESRTRLLKHFRSVDAIREAQPEEVAKAGRIPLALAKKVQSKLKRGGE
jgi:excinuclease ABC subunit C